MKDSFVVAEESSFPSAPTRLKQRPIHHFCITREVLERLSPLHRLAAEAAIRDGRWRLVDND